LSDVNRCLAHQTRRKSTRPGESRTKAAAAETSGESAKAVTATEGVPTTSPSKSVSATQSTATESVSAAPSTSASVSKCSRGHHR
jgi:CCR4-NOT transcriptional regulation complex NOT5 subunit